MRLSDHLQAARGGINDAQDLITNAADAILDAERFELTDDVAKAVYQLTTSKPTSLLATLPLCRAPYRKMWFEWRGDQTHGMIPEANKRDPLFAPVPLRQGALVETDETGQRGMMTFAWVHKDTPERAHFALENVCPQGVLFDWSEGADVREYGLDELKRRYPTKDALGSAGGMLDCVLFSKCAKGMSDEQTKAWMERSVFHDWARVAHVPQERAALRTLGRHAVPFISPHALGFFGWCAEGAVRNERVKEFLDMVAYTWSKDIEGEAPFIDGIIAMMNSRNAIETRPVDLSGLNKARVKRGRPTFLPYKTTHLRLSQAQTRAFRAGLLTRADAGRHRVRGHFKIRKTGIYWWSPFFRGDPTKPVHREEYVVT